VSPEVSDERAYQIKQLEAALRLEETKLLMLKKIRQNQQQALLNKVYPRLYYDRIQNNFDQL
jgi:hypothetical protein